MKKHIFLLSTLGVAAGFLYVLESNWRKQSGNGNAANGESGKKSELSAKTQAQTASRADAGNSNRENDYL